MIRKKSNVKIGHKNLKSKPRKFTPKYGTKLNIDEVNWEKVEKIFKSDRLFLNKILDSEKQRYASTRELLKLLAGGAIISLSFIMPALPMALAPFIVDRNKYRKGHFDQSINRLKNQKLVEIVYDGGNTLVKITNEGRVRALRYKLSEMIISKPKVWDKKWRLVIFDIPEKYKRVREIFRHHLKMMDFYQLQKSVWLHPYPCFDEIEFLRQIYGVSIDVTYIVAESIEDSSHLKERYDL